MPESCEATAISQAVSIDMAPCSRSRNSQSKPAAFITLMMSTLRTRRTPMPTASWFFLSRALAALTAIAMVSPVVFCARLALMSFHVERIDHVVLRVRDLAGMVRFYETALGFKVERTLDRIKLVQLRAGASLLDLVQGERPNSGGTMDHLAVRIAPFDRAAIAQKLSPLGIAMGETVQRYGAEGNGPSVYFNDPGGNQIELKGPTAT